MYEQEVIIVPVLFLMSFLVMLVFLLLLKFCPEKVDRLQPRSSRATRTRRNLQGIDGECLHIYSHGQKYRHPCNSVSKCNTSLRKLFQLQMFWYSRAYCFCLHCNNTKKLRRKVKLINKIIGIVKIVRNNCFSSM